MPRPERLGSLALLALGLGAASQALRLRVWGDGEPGEGLFPLLAALLLAGLSAASLVTGGVGPPRAEAARPRPGKVAGYAAALVVYGALFVAAGHVVATLVVFVTLLRVVERLSWTLSVAVAAATALATHVLFERLLGVPLPRGPL